MLPAPVGGQPVTLRLDDDSLASIADVALVILEGETTVNFELTGLDAGSTLLRANSPGLVEGVASVTVTSTLISVGDIGTVGLGESTSMVVSLSDPAPAPGVEVVFEVLDPTVASVSPTRLFIAEGQLTPTTNAPTNGPRAGYHHGPGNRGWVRIR